MLRLRFLILRLPYGQTPPDRSLSDSAGVGDHGHRRSSGLRPGDAWWAYRSRQTGPAPLLPGRRSGSSSRSCASRGTAARRRGERPLADRRCTPPTPGPRSLSKRSSRSRRYRTPPRRFSVRVEDVVDAVTASGGGHELHDPASALGAHGPRVVTRLHANHEIDEPRVNAVLARQLLHGRPQLWRRLGEPVGT